MLRDSSDCVLGCCICATGLLGFCVCYGEFSDAVFVLRNSCVLRLCYGTPRILCLLWGLLGFCVCYGEFSDAVFVLRNSCRLCYGTPLMLRYGAHRMLRYGTPRMLCLCYGTPCAARARPAASHATGLLGLCSRMLHLCFVCASFVLRLCFVCASFMLRLCFVCDTGLLGWCVCYYGSPQVLRGCYGICEAAGRARGVLRGSSCAAWVLREAAGRARGCYGAPHVLRGYYARPQAEPVGATGLLMCSVCATELLCAPFVLRNSCVLRLCYGTPHVLRGSCVLRLCYGTPVCCGCATGLLCTAFV